ncbi:MAG: phage tail tip lysozyme [Streptosporangiaceae bacterium]
MGAATAATLGYNFIAAPSSAASRTTAAGRTAAANPSQLFDPVASIRLSQHRSSVTAMARSQRTFLAREAARRAHLAAARRAAASLAAHRAAVRAAAAAAAAAAAHGPSCTGPVTGPVPQNYGAIVDFLATHGYSGLAAAGIAGNIYQESMGNPESVGSGGGGLIGWTPLPGGFVTGNPAADLQTQLQALLTYNQQWSQYVPMLNAATSATQAAYIYMTYFERPGIPAAANREAAAAAVATACHL